MFWATGCTEEADKVGGDDTIAETNAPEPVFPMDVSGVVVVESVHAIRHAGGRCLMEGDLRRLIGPLKTPVVIEAPDGQMARAEIVDAAATDVSGVCNFSFYASQVPALKGEYIASIPELGVEARFDQNHASRIEIRYIE